MLDVTEVLLDTEFATEFISVISRPVVMVKGRPTVPNSVRTDNVPAVVNSGVSELMRAQDQENMPNRISVHTLLRLKGPAKDGNTEYLPDLVIWRGDPYIVFNPDDYSRYGAGFIRADCESVSSIDTPTGDD